MDDIRLEKCPTFSSLSWMTIRVEKCPTFRRIVRKSPSNSARFFRQFPTKFLTKDSRGHSKLLGSLDAGHCRKLHGTLFSAPLRHSRYAGNGRRIRSSNTWVARKCNSPVAAMSRKEQNMKSPSAFDGSGFMTVGIPR